jgi:CBS domain containing-hemolysin-like protein
VADVSCGVPADGVFASARAPLVASPAGRRLTEEELSTIIETAQDEGVIAEGQGELLQSALEFSEIQAQEIITPRVNMLSIDIDDPRQEILSVIFNSPHSRIPVYKDSIDNIIGVLYVNQVLMALAEDPDAKLRPLLMPPCFIHKTMSLPAVLRELRSRKTHLAVVMDEYWRHAWHCYHGGSSGTAGGRYLGRNR